MPSLPSLPNAWSDLTWKQLTACWEVKMRYGGNTDVARAAALLALCGCSVCRETIATDTFTGEAVYTLATADGSRWTTTPRQLAYLAKQALPWFDFPYGDPGEEEERDEKGKVIKEAREAVRGYVSGFRDAMILPETEIVVVGDRVLAGSEWESMSKKEQKRSALHFALPQMACNNLTWQQYRSLQALAPQLFAGGISETEVVDMQAQFLAHCLVPAKDEGESTDKFKPRRIFRYNAERAEQAIPFWKEKMEKEKLRMKNDAAAAKLSTLNSQLSTFNSQLSTLFHICFQTYHTAILYYEKAYPILFTGGKNQEFRDALQGEIGTVNSVMKYQGYSDPQQVYDANLPIILDTLNTMAKEAREIEKMNAKIKKK